MGSKNLKAIAVKGTKSIPVADLKAAYAKGKEAYRNVMAKPGFEGWTPEGTAGITNWTNEVGVFPTREEIGRDIDFSDLKTVIFLLKKIARREGIGDLLAEGVKIAAEKTGQGSERFAIHVKGLEWSGYECRNAPSMMLAYMTADVGAHHNRAWVLGHDLAGAWTNVHDLIASGGGEQAQPKAVVSDCSAEYVIASQHKRSLFDALGNCRLQMMELGFEEEY
jgi:aldehyde:ferredoxin oxidoreductase